MTECTQIETRDAQPRMMTVREIVKTGLMSEHALRRLLKEDRLPSIKIGNKNLINFDRLCEQLQTLPTDVTRREPAQWFAR